MAPRFNPFVARGLSALQSPCPPGVASQGGRAWVPHASCVWGGGDSNRLRLSQGASVFQIIVCQGSVKESEAPGCLFPTSGSVGVGEKG